MPPVSQHSRTYLDFSNEKSSLRFNVQAITAANIVATQALITDIGLALLDLSRANLDRFQTVLEFVASNPSAPTDPYAQREIKWLVNYRDTTNGRMYQMEIPAAELTGNLLPGTDKADLASADWVAFVTAFEAGAKSQDGNAIEVVSAFVVGRNI